MVPLLLGLLLLIHFGLVFAVLLGKGFPHFLVTIVVVAAGDVLTGTILIELDALGLLGAFSGLAIITKYDFLGLLELIRLFKGFLRCIFFSILAKLYFLWFLVIFVEGFRSHSLSIVAELYLLGFLAILVIFVEGFVGYSLSIDAKLNPLRFFMMIGLL